MQRFVLLLLSLVLVVLGLWTWSRSGRLTPVVSVEATDPSSLSPEGSVPASTGSPAAGDPTAASALGERTVLEPADESPADAPLRGRLVDGETGESVPWYELGVSMRGARVCRVETDAQGRFETPLAYPAGTLTLSLRDVEGQATSNSSADMIRRLEHAPAAPEQDLRLDVGPTYFVQVELPAPLETRDLRVRLYVDPPAHREASGVAWPGPPTTVLRPPAEGLGTPWVRFRKPGPGGSPLWLSAESLDGLWRGGARVEGGPGVHPGIVAIELGPRCAVRGRFVSATPLERGGAQIALFRDVGGAQPLLWDHASAEDGFRIADLEPGAYRLEVRDEAVRASPVRFDLADGELDLGLLPWEPIPLAGTVRVRVQSVVELPLDLQLVRTLDPPRHPRWHSDDWEELPGGGFESVFEWEEVHAGEYALEVHSHGDRVNWHLSLGRIEPPVLDLVVELPGPADPVRLDVRTQDGDEVARWQLWLCDEGGWSYADPADGLLRPPFAAGGGVRWAVWSRGFRAEVGGLANASRPGLGERTLWVRLRPGWSRIFVVRDRGGSPVAGAEVWLDGALVGTTDALGELHVERATAPVDWEVRHPTLVWVDAGRRAQAGELEACVVHTTMRPR